MYTIDIHMYIYCRLYGLLVIVCIYRLVHMLGQSSCYIRRQVLHGLARIETSYTGELEYLHSVCDEARANKLQLAHTRSPCRRLRHWIRNANGANRAAPPPALGGAHSFHRRSSGRPAPRHCRCRNMEMETKKFKAISKQNIYVLCIRYH